MTRKITSITITAAILLLSTALVTPIFDDAHALKSDGVEIRKYGAATSNLVCGDILCSEVGKKQTMRHVSQVVAFQTVNGNIKLIGMEGTAEENPTIVLRTGFVLSLTVENQDDFAHMLMIEGLDIVTKDLAPGTRDHLMIFSYNTGEYNLVDVATSQNVGKLKIVKLQEDFPFSSQMATVEKQMTRVEKQITETSLIPKIPKESPGRLQATLAFEETNGIVQVVGIQGVSGVNPTLVTRTGYVYDLIIINRDTNAHSMFIDGLNLSSGGIPPGHTSMITIYPTKEGNYGYYAETMLSPIGYVKVVNVEPSIPKMTVSPTMPQIPSFGTMIGEPGRIKSTLQFETIDNKLSLVGIEGVLGINPTLVARTGFVYEIQVINKDSYPHALYLDGLNLQTRMIQPGETGMIAIYPSDNNVGKYSYYTSDPSAPLGNLLVLKVEPKTLSIKVPTMTVSAPGTIQATVAFDTVGGELKILGVKGTSEENPTLVTRTGYLYTLTVENHDSSPHGFGVEGLAMDTSVLQPGESSVLMILPSQEGEFKYFDEVTQKTFGNIKIVKVEPSFP